MRQWRFDPHQLYNVIVFFFLIYECMQIKTGYRHIGKCSNWFYFDFVFFQINLIKPEKCE